jgi:hypothetical protein
MAEERYKMTSGIEKEGLPLEGISVIQITRILEL